LGKRLRRTHPPSWSRLETGESIKKSISWGKKKVEKKKEGLMKEGEV